MIWSPFKKIFIRVSVTIALLLLIIQIPMINTFLAQGILNLYLPKGMSIHMSRLEGTFPFDLTAKRIKLKDNTFKKSEVWLEAENFHFSWRAADILYGNIHIEDLSADSITIRNIPLHLFTFDDDPIYLPYLNVDQCHINSLRMPFLYPGEIAAKADFTSDIQDNHVLTLHFWGGNDAELPALISAKYTQKEADYNLTISSHQSLQSFRSLSPSVLDQITHGQVDLALHLSGKSDFLDLGGSLEASVTNLKSTLPALQSLVGNSGSAKFYAHTQKSGEVREIKLERGSIITQKGLKATVDYVLIKEENSSEKAHHLKATLHFPDTATLLKTYGGSDLPLAGPANISIIYEGHSGKQHETSVVVKDTLWAGSTISPFEFTVSSSPEEIRLLGNAGVPKLADIQILMDLKKKNSIFTGPVEGSLKYPHGNLTMRGTLAHGSPLPWDVLPFPISPELTVHSLTIDHQNQPILALSQRAQIQGLPGGFLDGALIPTATLNILDGTLVAKNLHLGAHPSGEVTFQNISVNSIVTTLGHIFGTAESPQNASKDISFQGKVTGALKFMKDSASDSTGTAPYHATLSVKDFGVIHTSQHKEHLLSLDLEAKHSGTDLNWSGTLMDSKNSSVKWQGSVATKHLLPAPGDPIKYSLSGLINLSVLNNFMSNTDSYKGKIDVNLKGNGPLSINPFANLTGTLNVVEGTYNNALFGTIIRNVSATGAVKGNLLSLKNITARDFSKGSIEGNGTIDFAHLLQPRLNIHLSLMNFLLANNDESTIIASGNIGLISGTKAESPLKSAPPLTVTGKLTVEGATIILENASTDPKTIRLYRNAQELEAKLERPSKDSKTQLDLMVDVPKKLYIQGFGLKSVWAGKLHLKGPVNCPDIQGNIQSLNGRLDIANKHLTLDKSEISFTKGRDEKGATELVPLLDIKTSKIVGEYTAYLLISGSAFDPTFTFRSNPALSKEAVISLILFDKTLQKVTPAQTLQLATALANLNSKSFTGSAFNTLTSILGVDDISIAEADRKDKANDTGDDLGGAYALRVGKQLNDRIYVGIDQGIKETNETKALLKIDVTNNTKVDIETGTEDTSIGYNWEMRY